MKWLAAAALLLALCAGANASCPGSVAAGITLTMGVSTHFQVLNTQGCVAQAPSGFTVTGTGIGTVFNENIITVNSGTTPVFNLSPIAVGSGSISFAQAGFSTLTVPVTVNPATLDVVVGP